MDSKLIKSLRTKSIFAKLGGFLLSVGPPAGFLVYMISQGDFSTAGSQIRLTFGGILGVIFLAITIGSSLGIWKLKNIFKLETILLNLGLIFLILQPVIHLTSWLFISTGASMFIGKGLVNLGGKYEARRIQIMDRESVNG